MPNIKWAVSHVQIGEISTPMEMFKIQGKRSEEFSSSCLLDNLYTGYTIFYDANEYQKADIQILLVLAHLYQHKYECEALLTLTDTSVCSHFE